MRKLKDMKGITLIALVVTIVVLLILAAVSISMIGGENGIITQAKQSKEKSEQAKVEEIVDLVIGTLITENNGSVSGVTPKEIADKINAEYSQYENVYAEDEMNFPTNIIFPEENNRKVNVDLDESMADSDNIYNADVSEEDIAPVDIFKYEIISNAETGAASLDSLPTKEAKITGMNPKYCNGTTNGYVTDKGEVYENTNYEIILEDGNKITDTLIIPYQVEINGEMYKITETYLGAMGAKKDKGDDYYYGNAPKVKTIIFPNTIKKIGDVNNENIEEIVLSKNLEIITASTFYYCMNLKNIKIPNNVKFIGEYAFGSCINLTSIEIPSSVTSIEDNVFIECIGLNEIKVDRNNKKYDSRENCNAIIETSTNTLLYGCKNTKIPNGVINIGEYAFYYCINLISIEIPNSVRNIERSAFVGCSGLTSIKLEGSMTSIGDYTFFRCSSLTSIEIPSTVTSIGSSAFSECSSLTSIEIPSSVTSIEGRAFSGCNSLTTVNYTGTKAQWEQISIDNSYDGNADLTNAKIVCTDETINP